MSAPRITQRRERRAAPWLRWVAVTVALAAGAGLFALLVTAPDACAQTGGQIAQAGNDVGRNLGGLLRRWGGQIYGGVVGIVSLVFLVNRRYKDLALFFMAAVVVAWLVFSPDQVANAARGIGRQILG
jgi:hypothetical protein